VENIITALTIGQTDDPDNFQLTLKVAQTIKHLEAWPELKEFFMKLFRRPEMQEPSNKQKAYLNALFDQINEVLPVEMLRHDPEQMQEKIKGVFFELLLRYNFNHESVYKFFVAQIGQLALLQKDNAEQTLREIRFHCEVRPRKDMAYNKKGNSLGEDLIAEVDRRLDSLLVSDRSFHPIDLGVHGNVFIPMVGLMEDAGLLKRRASSEKFYKSLSKVFRTNDGKFLKTTTIKSRIGGDDASNLEECREILEDMMDHLDMKMKLATRKKRVGKELSSGMTN